MDFDLDRAMEILARTPPTLDALLRDLSPAWTSHNEGGEMWSPFDVVGHLIHGERTDWIPRAEIVLEKGETQPFEPFDRFAQFEVSTGRTLEELLDTFAALRVENLQALRDLRLEPSDYERAGHHPEFGRVTMRQLLSTWVVHDLSHIRQIARVMARQYATSVGPWRAYLPGVGRRVIVGRQVEAIQSGDGCGILP